MKRIASCETFRRAGKSTQPALPTLPDRQVSETLISTIIEEIDDILEESRTLPRTAGIKSTFLEHFMQLVDQRTTQLLNDRSTS
jgi:hypothetical protein